MDGLKVSSPHSGRTTLTGGRAAWSDARAAAGRQRAQAIASVARCTSTKKPAKQQRTIGSMAPQPKG